MINTMILRGCATLLLILFYTALPAQQDTVVRKRAAAELQQLKIHLHVDAVQSSKIYPVLMSFYMRIDSINHSVAFEQRKNYIVWEEQQRLQQLKEILSAVQFEQYRQNLAAQREHLKAMQSTQSMQ